MEEGEYQIGESKGDRKNTISFREKSSSRQWNGKKGDMRGQMKA